MRYQVQPKHKGTAVFAFVFHSSHQTSYASVMPCTAAVQGRFSAFDIQCIPSICKKQFDKFYFTKSYFTKL